MYAFSSAQSCTIQYRPQVVDLDGIWEDSSIQEAEITKPEWRIYPQPPIQLILPDLIPGQYYLEAISLESSSKSRIQIGK